MKKLRTTSGRSCQVIMRINVFPERNNSPPLTSIPTSYLQPPGRLNIKDNRYALLNATLMHRQNQDKERTYLTLKPTHSAPNKLPRLPKLLLPLVLLLNRELLLRPVSSLDEPSKFPKLSQLPRPSPLVSFNREPLLLWLVEEDFEPSRTLLRRGVSTVTVDATLLFGLTSTLAEMAERGCMTSAVALEKRRRLEDGR